MRNELLYVSHPRPPFAHPDCTRLVRHVCSRSHCIATPRRRGWFAARINKIVATPRETTSSYNKKEKESRGWLETGIERDKRTGDKGWWTWSAVIEHKSSLRRPPAIGIFFIEPRVNIYLVHVLATPTRCHDNCAAESWTVLIASRRCSRSQEREREIERERERRRRVRCNARGIFGKAPCLRAPPCHQYFLRHLSISLTFSLAAGLVINRNRCPRAN